MTVPDGRNGGLVSPLYDLQNSDADTTDGVAGKSEKSA